MSSPSHFSALLSPSLQPGTLRVGPHAAARAMLLTVTSLKNSLLPTSFLCRVTRHSSASCCLSQQSGSNLRDATSDIYPRATAYGARGPPGALQQPRRCYNLPPPRSWTAESACRDREQLGWFSQSQDEAPGRNTQMLRYQPADIQQMPCFPIHRAHLFL